VAFVLGIVCLIASTLRSSPRESILGLLLISAGLPFYFYWKSRSPASRPASDPQG
jgi:hypothetical protein